MNTSHWYINIRPWVLLLVLGCSYELTPEQMCEPCPSGYACTETPFGTFDCVPESSGAVADEIDSANLSDMHVAQTDDLMAAASDMFLLADATHSDVEPLDSEALDSSSRLPAESGYDADANGAVDQNNRAQDAGEERMGHADDDTADSESEDSHPLTTEGTPLPDTVSMGAKSRITALVIPENVSAATAAGCEVIGRNVGHGLSGLLALFPMTLTEQLQPNEVGFIPVVLLTQFLGWMPGMTPAEYGEGTLEVYLGIQGDGDTFSVDQRSFELDVEPRRSKMRFQVRFVGDRFQTDAGVFRLRLSGFTVPLTIQLTDSTLVGRVHIAASGLSMTETLLSGYLHRSAILDMVRTIQASCRADSTDAFCETANNFFDLNRDAADIANIILPLIGRLDARVDESTIESCDPTCSGPNCLECNAVSVCAMLESTPVHFD